LQPGEITTDERELIPTAAGLLELLELLGLLELLRRCPTTCSSQGNYRFEGSDQFVDTQSGTTAVWKRHWVEESAISEVAA
jgi:hypothetical protein